MLATIAEFVPKSYATSTQARTSQKALVQHTLEFGHQL